MKFFISNLVKARKLHGRRVVHGMAISVENQAGSVRRWYDPFGKETGSTKMKHDYGYIRRTEGTDGDHVDVYVGPNPASTLVVVVNQMKKPDFTEFDEQKVMLGFDTAIEAKRAYLAHYNDERFFGSMLTMHVNAFKRWVLARENHGSAITETATMTKHFFSLSDLAKAAGRPPGGGWMAIPGGKKGGYRKPDGKGGYEYWYPGHASPPRASQEPHEAPAKEPGKAGWSEEEFRAGSFDKNPAHWHERVGHRAPWTSGGVDPHSAHPVKYAGRPAKLYQIVQAEADNAAGMAVLKDVETGERMLARHDRVLFVEHAPERSKRKLSAPQAPQTPQGPRWTPGATQDEPGFTEGGVAGVSGERAPKFADSVANPTTQPGLFSIENGVYPIKSVERVERDDDGVVRKVKHTRIAVPDHGKHQLVQEFERLIASSAKQMQKRFNVKSEWEVHPDGKRVDIALVDLRRAGVEGLLAAIEHYDARGPFAATAQQFVRDHVRMNAAREALGGIGLPMRHQRNLGRFVAARAKAAAALGKEDPSPEEVLPFFALKKRHVHSDLSNDIGNQPVPVEDYNLRSATQPRDQPSSVEEDTKTSPGLRSLTTLYHDFITGAKSSEEFSDDKFTLPALGMGAEFSPEQRILARNAIARAMKTLDEISVTTEGRKKIEYTTDVSEVLSRKLGIFTSDREAQTDAQIARDIPIFANGKRVAENSARALVAQFVEKGLAHLRDKLDDERTQKLIERATERLVPPVVVVNGPTWMEVVAERATKVPASAVVQYRTQEAQRMRTQAERMRDRAREQTDENTQKTQMSLADGLEQAARRAERMPEGEVRMRIAQQASPETAEMRRLATQSIAVDVHAPGSYAHMTVEMTDPATGAQRTVRVRKLTDIKSKWDQPIVNPLHKAEDASKLHASMLRDVMLYPRLMRLLYAPEDAVGAAPTLARYVTETLAGVV